MVPELQDIIDVANNMLWTCLMLSMPPLLTALAVGVSVSLVQTITSIQEMTLTFVPKLLAVVAVVALSLPRLIDFITSYFENTLQMFSSYYEREAGMSEDMFHVSRILSAFLTYVLVLLRCGCLVLFAPFFSSEAFPGRIRVFFAMTFPLLFIGAASRTARVPESMDMARLAMLAGQEFAVGMTLAYLGTLIFTGIQFAGEVAGQQIGFAMASVMDPQSGVEMPMLGFINMNLAIMVFLAAKLHLVYVHIMIKSYDYVGIGAFLPEMSRHHPALVMSWDQATALVQAGLRMAGPVILVMLLTSIVEGFITKTMPQLNIQVFGMPLKVTVGLCTLIFLYPALCAVLVQPDWRFNLEYMPDGPFGDTLAKLAQMAAAMGR